MSSIRCLRTDVVDLVPQRDWLAENLASFPPLHIGRYFIYGSHVEVAKPAGAVTLNLDPGTAFGSGEHASTAGCLTILDTLAKSRRFKRPLDMGCGSGILALAMAKGWGGRTGGQTSERTEDGCQAGGGN